MAITVGELKKALDGVSDDLEVAFVSSREYRLVADTAFKVLGVIKRDSRSHAPTSGPRVETKEPFLKGRRETVFALSDR